MSENLERNEIVPVAGETRRRPSERWAGQVNVRLDAETKAALRRLTAGCEWPDNTPQFVIRDLILQAARELPG